MIRTFTPEEVASMTVYKMNKQQRDREERERKLRRGEAEADLPETMNAVLKHQAKPRVR